MTVSSDSPNRLLAAGALFSVLCIGLAVPASERLGVPTSAVLVLGAAPALVLFASRWPVATLGLMVGSQVMDHFQVSTPVGTVAVRTTLLVALVLTQFPRFQLSFRSHREVRVVSALFAIWLAVYPIRALHTSPDIVARSMLTQASFLAIGIVGVALARSPQVLRSVAAGSTFALSLLGILGALASLGYLPLPARVQLDRVILGISSPFIRNYGLNVPFDAVALLVPLCVPFCFLVGLRHDATTRHRITAGAMLIAVTLATLFVFQAREMLLQIAVAGMLSVALLLWRRKLVLVLLTPIAAFVFWQATAQLLASDPLSSGIRAGTDRVAIATAFASPNALIFGSNQDVVFAEGSQLSGYGQAVSYGENDNVIHNLFLQNLSDGGLVALLPFLAAHLLLLRRAIALWSKDRNSLEAQVLLVALTLVLLALNIEPVRANIIGSWLVIGLCLGAGAVGLPSTLRSQSGLRHGRVSAFRFEEGS